MAFINAKKTMTNGFKTNVRIREAAPTSMNQLVANPNATFHGGSKDNKNLWGNFYPQF